MKDTINRLIRNYTGARKSWETWCFLNDIDMKISSHSVWEQCNSNELLSHFRYLALKDLHIELYKILKDSERSSKDNIFKLLKNDKQDHQELILKFNGIDSVIKDITSARDKIYAHLDPDYNEYMKSFKIDVFYKVFHLIEKSLINLGFECELLKALDSIPSRNEFSLSIQ